MRQRLFNSALTISLVLLTPSLRAEDLATPRTGLGLDVISTVGSQLDKQNDKASLTLEPTVTYQFDSIRYLELYSAFDRPFNPYDKVTVPKTILTFGHEVSFARGTKSLATVALTALSLDRWSTDGRMMRGSVALTHKIEPFTNFTISFKAGPFAQTNEYRQTTAGRDLPKYGFAEKLIVEYTIGRFVLDFVLLADQRYSVNWKNGYSTLEQAAYRLDDQWTLGLSHELIGSTLDDSTGRFHALQVFDERNSRVSAFVEYTL